MRKYTPFLISGLLLFLPLSVFAFQLVTCGSPGASNPNACGFSDLINMFNGALTWFLSIAVSVAAITFAWAGAKMLFNPGNSAKREEALEMFKKTIIGLLIVLCAWLVINTAISALTGAVTGSGPLQFL